MSHPRPAKARAALLALSVAWAGAAACFEGGALDVLAGDLSPADTAVAQDTAQLLDGVAVDGTAPPEDAVEDSVGLDTGGSVDSGGGPDGADGSDSVAGDTAAGDTAVADTLEARPCLTIADCAGVVAPGDKCAGTIGCVDYQCVVDPDTVVVCPPPSDPCLSAHCEPATGACVSEDTCLCSPVGALACGVPVSYTTGAPGETEVLDGYACGGPGAFNTGPERVFTLTVPTDQRVRVRVDSFGVGGVFVVPLGGGDCAPDGCLAGGSATALLDAPGGEPLAVVVEHTFAGLPVTITADCGLSAEDACGDGLDDDGDGLTDCADTDCVGHSPCGGGPTTETSCSGGVDDDGDGLTDCADGDCFGVPPCGGAGETQCTDGADNDLDGKTDCADGDCVGVPPCSAGFESACADGFDNDGDGKKDCADPDCTSTPACTVTPPTEAQACFDGLDNDSDGKRDCADSDCWSEPSCLQACFVTTTPVANCGFSQGATTGGGKTRMSTYSCGTTPMPGKEIVYRFVAAGSGLVTVSMSSGTLPLSLFVLEDQGLGCTPLHCLVEGPKTATFYATVGKTYFFAIDGPEGVSGAYQLVVTCAL